ncbi:MAG: alanine--glyoxylate aminotransferase family protein [Desulfovibrio sp.]|jgi:aspartate aminotransferase-like enzyme|nr:alanine--glyoxylate aminotransferase family protein [Desulfovibrio sp.]
MLNKTRLLTPGPTPLPERVRLALARDMIHHRKKDFAAIMDRVQPRLQQLFGTSQPVLPLSSSGTGAMTAAVYGLFSPGEKVLVVVGGKFGERWRNIAASRHLEIQEVTVPWGHAVDPSAVEEVLDRDPEILGVLVQLSETSTGVLHPVQELGAITKKRDCLLVVDGISGVGLSPCPMDKWGIDCLLTGSQKGLMLPPGLALLALSSRAWERAAATEPGCFYFNLPKERNKLAQGQTLFTSPVNLIVGLDESLDMLLENGLEAVYAKQWALTMLTRTGVQAMGLTPYVKERFAWGITSVLVPEGLDGTKLLAIIADRFGVVLAGGQDSLKGRILRIGHMGWVDWADVLGALQAVKSSVIAMGGSCPPGDPLGKAMEAYLAALELPPGTPPPNGN